MINKEQFYSVYRNEFGSIRKNATVEAINALINEYEKYQESLKPKQTEKFAYILATVRYECGGDMLPITENLRYSAKRLVQVWPSRFNWHTARQYAYNPRKLGNKVYGGRLGNGALEGYKYRGRGFVQLTGYINYKKFSDILGIDLVDKPELALKYNYGARILIDGMIGGLFTGRKLSGYIKPSQTDYYNARSIVNADRGRVGRKIARDAEKFEKIIRQSTCK